MSTQLEPQAARPRTGPRPRTLALLLIAVLLVHGLVLRTAPTHFGPTLDPAARRAPAFTTRSIQPAPANEAGTPAPAPAPAAPKPPAKPAKNLVSRSNSPQTQQPSTPVAIETEVSTEPDTAPTEAPAPGESAMPAEPDSAPASRADAADAASANPAPAQTGTKAAAGALPELSPGPRQTVVTAIKLPESARLDYKVMGSAKGLNYHASAVLNWQNMGSSYEAGMTVSVLFIGSRSMASQGRIVSEGLAPGRFADKYKSEVAAHFEQDKGQVSFSANTPTIPWVQGMQDRVSVFFQLAGMLAGNPQGFPVGSTISMVTVGPRDADGWTFVVEAAEKLALPLGELDTLRLSRQPRKQFDQKVEIWYAPSLGYLPVRSRITQANGDFVDQQLSAIVKPGS